MREKIRNRQAKFAIIGAAIMIFFTTCMNITTGWAMPEAIVSGAMVGAIVGLAVGGLWN